MDGDSLTALRGLTRELAAKGSGGEPVLASARGQAAMIDASFIVFLQIRSSVRSGVPHGGRM